MHLLRRNVAEGLDHAAEYRANSDSCFFFFFFYVKYEGKLQKSQYTFGDTLGISDY